MSCSALELSAGDLAGREYWGDLKYVGVVLLPPAYLAFVLQCSGHTRWPRWLGPALALEPLAVLLLLAGAATHDLVRYYPPDATLATAQAAEAGPLFWPHLLYNNAIIWIGTILLIVTLSRMSRLYRGQSVLLVGAVLLPIISTSCSTWSRPVPAGRPDPVRLRAVHGGASRGIYQLSL